MNKVMRQEYTDQ